MKAQLLAAETTIKALQIAARDRKIELFESWKSAGDFDKAERFYEDLLANDLVEGVCAENAAIILGLKQSYVDMLIKQGGRFEKALDLAKEVWDKRQGADPVPDISRECHRQLCTIYASLKRPEEAERMHKVAYEFYKGLDDVWSFENGDECCKRLAEQQKYDEAALMQANVWTERQKKANGGPRHPDTIKSGLSRILFLEKQRDTLADQAGSESEKNLRRSERETCEHKIYQALQYIWDTAKNPERDTGILDAGRKLGDRHLAANRFPEAEAVLTQVWQGMKLVTGDADASTVMDVRYKLGRAMYHQGQAKYDKATRVLQAVYDQWYGTSPDAASIRECGCLLVEMYEHQRAVEPIKALFDGRKRLGSRCILYLQSGHAYGKLLVEQAEYGLARELMKSLWDCDAALVTEKESRLQCGRLYGQIILDLGDFDLAHVILQSVTEAQNGVITAGTSEATKVSELLRQVQQQISAKTSSSLGRKTAKGAAKPRKVRTGDNRHVTTR